MLGIKVCHATQKITFEVAKELAPDYQSVLATFNLAQKEKLTSKRHQKAEESQQ